MMLPSIPSSLSSTALNVTRGRCQSRIEKDGKKFGSRGRSMSRGKSQDKKTAVCWKCGKSGHFTKDCRVKTKATDPPLANVAQDFDEEDDLLEDGL
ncbi:hypothetical protein Mapa_009485 [Marchantia paleacea]|nr:hypothetical protein Mapa_009485 [Marchantia paleacea]